MASQNERFGTYALRLYVPPAVQEFALNVGTSAPAVFGNAQPGAGAGSLETWLSRDVYSFSVPAGSEVFLDTTATSSYVLWQVKDAQGQVVQSGKFNADARITGLAGGNYQLVTWIDPAPLGVNSATYAGSLLLVPAAQVFEVDLGGGPVEVSNGKPGVGAGNLETKASVDEYVFTVGAGGSRVLAEFQPVGNSWNGNWSVLDAQGQVVKAGVLSDAAQWRFDQELAAGQYRLRMASQNERFGTYALRLYVPPAVQEFALNVGTSAPAVFGNAQPGAGAGSLETWLSRDVYSFSVPAGSEVFLDTTATSSYVLWQVKDAQGQVVQSGKFNADARITGLAGGNYQLVTWIDPAPLGVNSATYAGSLLLVR